MRTENQIKRKMNELQIQKQTLESKLAGIEQRQPKDEAEIGAVTSQVERLDDMILLLEWVLNEPMGNYHA